MRGDSLALLMLLVSCAVGGVLTVLSGPLVGLAAPAGTLLALVRHRGGDGDDGDEQETETIECSRCGESMTVESGRLVDVVRCSECPAEGARGPFLKLLGAVRSRWAA